MSKRRQRALKAQFMAKFGRVPNRAGDTPSEVRALHKAWYAYTAMAKR